MQIIWGGEVSSIFEENKRFFSKIILYSKFFREAKIICIGELSFRF